MDEKIYLLASQLGKNRLKENIDLTSYLKSKLGGMASAFYIATTTSELIKIIQLCKELKLSFLVFGLGSKIAISHQGFQGVAIKNRCDGLKIFGIKGKVSRKGIGIEEAFLEAESGASLERLNGFALAQGLGGLEDFSSTLGTIGGSFLINQILREKAAQVKVLTKENIQKTKQVREVDREDIILSVIFKLKAKSPLS
ncbi:MAG: FAD-binding protein [Candidatus Daviesbacteria bacterium]